MATPTRFCVALQTRKSACAGVAKVVPRKTDANARAVQPAARFSRFASASFACMPLARENTIVESPLFEDRPRHVNAAGSGAATSPALLYVRPVQGDRNGAIAWRAGSWNGKAPHPMPLPPD